MAAEHCTPVDAAELQLLLARLDAEEDEKVRADLDRDLHLKIGKMTGNPMIFSVLSASAQLTENIITGIRAYIMQKNHTASEVDEQHRRMVGAIVSHQPEQAAQCMQEHMATIERYIAKIIKAVQGQAAGEKLPGFSFWCVPPCKCAVPSCICLRTWYNRLKK